MHLAEFDLPFDASLVAERPVEPRDQARLLVAPRSGGSLAHKKVTDLPGLLAPGDLLVVNDSRVLAARLSGRKRPGGGRVELLLVRPLGPDTWEALIKGRMKPGQVIDLDARTSVTVLAQGPAGCTVQFSSAQPASDVMSRLGQMPLPPYIKREPVEQDRTWYQTIFARPEGSIAAPTASLHFTEGLSAALRARGIGLAAVTLHVGPGTFRPVTADRIEDHVMYPERFEVSEATVEAIKRAKASGGRVVAVGTTVVRTLEASAAEAGQVRPMTGDTALFITPGYRFRVVDALMTNFHLPRTTLAMLVSAFVGLERLREVYAEAVREKYRFYSYGDAMLIL
ncbi:MAG: tRNA preQ1(34) S-adenosylmethionine ribosyltransferase-isomerase QueA [Nitrospirota bacterium]|nr:tRNA preQ1(34) S-adenosylmethionine ribosyltransferase-isomerase QueA [Nitrospirota bacterium]MDE3034822.1 tRNA preQ1(34) S-adenosylmethionine ribosyltransferase-isomerase QueA [Nitrospirota bacterium]MDE3225151.1 tRNA preQ1(34) S-adenosylmethionine ribosyltransferase-isomerase QueA [Nitrospirota bacterium]MDE3242525.1 tRNA preQ1(34) S-adenosylmethionine ribosyltransferase-isomerase QueA [Nitrospirota bacterium]